MTILSPPKISIVIPVLNGGRTLEKAIQSVVQQSYQNFELIILDGGSTDNTLDIIQKYKQHITYWHSKRDGNPCIALNEGIKLASGDLIAGFMSDDFYEPELFERIANAYKRHPDAEIFSCGGRMTYYDDHVKALRVTRTYSTDDDLALNFYNVCFGEPAICCRFISKKLHNRIGYFLTHDETGRIAHAGDKEFLLRAIVHNAKNITIDYIGHNYLSHPGSFTFSNNRAMTVILYSQHMSYAKKYLAEYQLSQNQRAILQKWYHHQSARLAFYYLFKRKFNAAFAIIKNDFPQYHLYWLFSFMTAAPDFALRKLKRIFKNIYQQFSGTNILHETIQ